MMIGMNRHVVGLLAAACALSACGSISKSVPTAAPEALAMAVQPSPETTQHWTKERMEKAKEHFATYSGTPTARTLDKVIRTGAIFDSDTSGDHFCTGSVVSSPNRDIILTAAHCIHSGKGGSYQKNLVFVPNYQNGATPDGIWPVKEMVVDKRWADSSDPDLDVAFMAVNTLNGKRIEDVLKGNKLGIDQGFTNVVLVIGYPKSSDQPIACGNRTSQQSAHQMRFACNGYFGGTSGSPWLTHFDEASGTGTVIGDIGGYQEGGDSDNVSYSPYFDQDVKNLYDKAVAGS
jgi:V8-like Glu-specific endopeptidase